MKNEKKYNTTVNISKNITAKLNIYIFTSMLITLKNDTIVNGNI